ncbi:MAG TPA: hypothetical protein PKY96_13440 [Flavobacteriales bacterium]|nr:hypothetical protein [Flavobacteriales bacterium]
MARRKRKGPPDHRASDGSAIPPDFAARLPLRDEAERNALINALETPSPVSIRLNPLKPFTLDAERVPWCDGGRYLAERPSFSLDPLLHAGAYYVQEASSMLLEQAILATGLNGRDVLALDLCAAPGGKSTHLLALLTPGSLLVANELHPQRRSILAENCWKQGALNVVIGGSRSSDLGALPGEFDLILLDAPCSGEGMFRKDAFARAQWSEDLVEQCAAAQHELIHNAWHALSPGGALVYSTCTWEPMENEAQVAGLVALGGECMELKLDSAWGIERSELHGIIGYRCYPHRVRGEGFFMSVVRKPGGLEVRKLADATSAPSPWPWLIPATGLQCIEREGVQYAQPFHWSSHLGRIGAAMRLVAPGIPFAERKGDAWVPHAAAALSAGLDRRAVQVMELEQPDALRYLRGEALPARGAEGLALASFRGFGLGWMHGAGTRWNNRWPATWRLRLLRSDAPTVPWSKH